MDLFLFKKIPEQFYYCRRGLSGFLEVSERIEGKDIIPINLFSDAELQKGVQLASIAVASAAGISGGDHPLQACINDLLQG